MSNVTQYPGQQQVMTLIVEFRPDKVPSIPVNIVALPVSPYLPLNGLVDQIEFFYAQQAMKHGVIEGLQVIYLESKINETTRFNYNMPVKSYFNHGDTIVCHGEIVRAMREPMMEMKEEKDKLPVTIITGFLGSGKTTLLNRILKEKHGKRIMVIQNEFGSIEIDGTLAEDAMFSKEDIQILDNGCACCTVRGDLGKAFVEILEKSNESEVNIEHIIVETTGLANPAPIIQTFYQERDVAVSLKLDGILTVIDAKNVLKHIDEVPAEDKVNESVEQVSFADRILLNKMDLVTGAEARIVKDKIRSINAFAKIIPTTQVNQSI
jgi:Ni2+-binding GTPase involved in maturation of urease and hydrogenase